jgi:hypothetical protein
MPAKTDERLVYVNGSSRLWNIVLSVMTAALTAAVIFAAAEIRQLRIDLTANDTMTRVMGASLDKIEKNIEAIQVNSNRLTALEERMRKVTNP